MHVHVGADQRQVERKWLHSFFCELIPLERRAVKRAVLKEM